MGWGGYCTCVCVGIVRGASADVTEGYVGVVGGHGRARPGLLWARGRVGASRGCVSWARPADTAGMCPNVRASARDMWIDATVGSYVRVAPGDIKRIHALACRAHEISSPNGAQPDTRCVLRCPSLTVRGHTPQAAHQFGVEPGPQPLMRRNIVIAQAFEGSSQWRRCHLLRPEPAPRVRMHPTHDCQQRNANERHVAASTQAWQTRATHMHTLGRGSPTR